MRIELSPWQTTETTMAVAAAASSGQKGRRRKRESSSSSSTSSPVTPRTDTTIIESSSSLTVATSFVEIRGNQRTSRQRKKARKSQAAAAADGGGAGTTTSTNVRATLTPSDELDYPPCLVITSENSISIVGRRRSNKGGGDGNNNALLHESELRRYTSRPGMRFLPRQLTATTTLTKNEVKNGNKKDKPSSSSSICSGLKQQQQQLTRISALLDGRHERLYAFSKQNQRLISWSTFDGPDQAISHSFDEAAASLNLIEVLVGTPATTPGMSTSDRLQTICYGSLANSKKLFVGTLLAKEGIPTDDDKRRLEVETFEIPKVIGKKMETDDVRLVATLARPADSSNESTTMSTSGTAAAAAAAAGTKRKSASLSDETTRNISSGTLDLYQVLMGKDRILLVRHTVVTNTESTPTPTAPKMKRVRVQTSTIMLPPNMQQVDVMVDTVQFVGVVPNDNNCGDVGTVILAFQTSTAPCNLVSFSLGRSKIVAGPFALSCGSIRGSASLLVEGRRDSSRTNYTASAIVAVPTCDDDILLYDAIRGALIQRLDIRDLIQHNHKATTTTANANASPDWALTVDSKRSLLAILYEKNDKVCVSLKSLVGAQGTSRNSKALSLADGLAAAAAAAATTTKALSAASNALVAGSLSTSRKKLKSPSVPGQQTVVVQSLLILSQAHDAIRGGATKTTTTKDKIKAGYLRDAFKAAIATAAGEISGYTNQNSSHNDNDKSNSTSDDANNKQVQDDRVQEQEENIITVSANPQDDRSPLHDEFSSPILKSSADLINGVLDKKAVNGQKTYDATLAASAHVPIASPPTPPAPPASATTVSATSTTAGPRTALGPQRKGSPKPLESLPAGFLDGAVTWIVQILLIPLDDSSDHIDSKNRIAIHSEAQVILKRLVQTEKTSARAIFNACSTSGDKASSWQKFLQSLEPSEGKKEGPCYSPLEFALDVLNNCTDVSERHMMLLIQYLLTSVRPEHVAGYFLRKKKLYSATHDSYIAMSERFIKLQQRSKNVSSNEKNKDDTGDKNDDDVDNAKEIDRLSSKLILVGTDALLDAILSYSDFNKTLIRGALTQFIPRNARLFLAKILLKKRAQPCMNDSACKSWNAAKSNRLVLFLSSVCDSLQHGQSGSNAELDFFQKMQVELEREVLTADLLLKLQQTLNETTQRAKQASPSGPQANGSSKQQVHPYQVERLVF